MQAPVAACGLITAMTYWADIRSLILRKPSTDFVRVYYSTGVALTGPAS